MGRVFNAVVDYLTEDDWKFTVLEGDGAFVLSFRGKAGSWQCFGRADEEKECFTFYSILPPHAPEDKRLKVAEFVTRANYGLIIGNFELDFRDGQVRYKTSIDIEGGELTHKMVENLIYANLTTMDDYFPGFMSVMYGDREPAEAIDEIEGKGRARPPAADEDDYHLEDLDEDEAGEGDDKDKGFGSARDLGIE
ncbi:MAG TPA: YbjN domain-containing protein [Gemmataceae bacterium]|nr:YbjN domain-containing protein [Gemmataceae bacterium]